jgi:sugar (pentulose or hexulose) kinase
MPALPGTVSGPINNRDVANKLGLPTGIPLVLGSLDHYMAAVGAGLGTTAQATISLGTVIACVSQTPDFAPQKNICIARAVKGQGFHQLTWDTNGASVLEWYNRTFCPEMEIAHLIEEAAQVPADCAGLIAKPNANQYQGLHGFENIRKTHAHGHFARAIMQSTAETLKRLIIQLCPDQMPRKIAATGGGAKSRFWLDICSKTLNTEVFAADTAEPACKGAATCCQMSL